MAYLGFFIFCLYRKKKGENDLINTPIICDSSATGGRDNGGYEDVFVHADISEERGDNQLRSGSRGSNSRRQHDDARHVDWTGHNDAAFQADERNEREDTLHDDITMLIHATNRKEEPYLPDGNKSRPDPRGAGREDGKLGGQEMNRARGRKTRADWPWPGKHAARDDRGYHDAGSHGDARDAYPQGQTNGREKNPSRMDLEVELNDTEPVIRGGKLILRQISREEDII
ncbi:uncharacterized protein LOC124274181 [Haliotis rubra]|uniref:uncharacterized protein LOC124274181 n=1 Tax=Haliotis rubra TaxID=36100 RepID=UPI001EE54CFF|nr:uncharacterized protein LOC124274181 [Haliotis rubra]